MRLTKFSERFNLEIDAEEAKHRFMLRMNASFFQSDFYKKDLRHHQDVLAQKAAGSLLEPYRFYTTPQSYIGDDFFRCLQVVEVMFAHFHELNDRERVAKIDTLIKEILGHDSIRLALEWKDGRFFPTSPDLLDRSLIEETLTWLAVMDSKPLSEAYAAAIGLFVKNEIKPEAAQELLRTLSNALLLFLKQLSNTVSQDPVSALLAWSGRFPENSYGRMLAGQVAEQFKFAQQNAALSRSDRESLLFLTGTFFRWNIETVFRRRT